MGDPASIHASGFKAGRVLAGLLIVFGGLTTTSVVFFAFTLPRIMGSGSRAPAVREARVAPSSDDGAATAPRADAADGGGNVPRPNLSRQADGASELFGAAPDSPADPPAEAMGGTPAAALPLEPGQSEFAGAGSPRELAEQVAEWLAAGARGPLPGHRTDPPAIADGTGSAGLSGDAVRRMRLLPSDRADGHPGVREIGRLGDLSRWEIPVEGVLDGLPVAGRLLLDVVRGKDGRWENAGLAFPGAWRRRLDSDPEAMERGEGPSAGRPVASADEPPDADPDPLAASDAFLRALAGRDWTAARSLVEPGAVSDEKLAALMIAIEDGGFGPAPDRTPLEVTAVGPDAAWAIAALRAPGTTDAAEFGIEWLRTEDGGWRAVGLNFSRLIASVAEASGAGEIGYAPIVENPAGGESIVLYFPFNSEAVHPRAARQLGIIAGLLRADATKRLTIGGHADAVGSDAFNDRLSDARARNVRDALLALGVPPAQIVVRAFGEREPVEPNVNADGSDNPAGRSRNRRAEVLLDFRPSR